MATLAIETEIDRSVGSDSVEINQRAFQNECKAWMQARRHKSRESKIVWRYEVYPKETKMVRWKTKFKKVRARLKNCILFSKK